MNYISVDDLQAFCDNSKDHAITPNDFQRMNQIEVVLCKNCENWIPGYITDQDDFIPPKCGKYKQMVGHSNDDFCSLAERK